MKKIFKRMDKKIENIKENLIKKIKSKDRLLMEEKI